MESPTLNAAVLAVALLLTGGASQAHHNASSQFDSSQRVAIEGVLTRFDWTNPHVYLYLETTADSGETALWEIQAGSIGSMRRMGWSQDTLTIGERLSVEGNPSRRQKKELLLIEASRPAERLPRTHSSETPAQRLAKGRPAENLAGVWYTQPDQNLMTGVYFLPPEQLTDRGRAAAAAYDDETMFPGLDCVPYTAPMSMVIPDLKSIEFGEGIATIRAEYEDTTRTVYLEQAPPPQGTELQGIAVGRWDGEALVVRTTRFAEHRVGNGLGVPTGPRRELTERFELDADRRLLVYRFELKDPDYLAKPLTGQSQWVHRPDMALDVSPCDPDSARRYGSSRPDGGQRL